MELDFIAKDNDFHKVEIFLNLINYLFTHRLFPDGLQSARSSTAFPFNLKYTTAKKAVSFPWKYQPQMPTFLALFLKFYIVILAHTNDACQAQKTASFRAFNAAILKCFVLPTSYN